MKAKKADTMAFQVIVVLVIVIAFALIYFFWLRDYRTSGENLSDYQICKSSNFENAKLKLKIDSFAIQERSGNKCETEYLKVPEDQELSFIARKLAGCWDMYLEGKERLFDTEDNNYCAMCSVLTFEDTAELKGLTSYLMDTVAPGTGGKKYYEYLNRVIVKKENMEEVEIEKEEKQDIVPAVAYIFGSYNNTIVHITDLAGRTIARVSGGMVTKHSRLKLSIVPLRVPLSKLKLFQAIAVRNAYTKILDSFESS